MTSNRQLTINGLRACGWTEVLPRPSTKYRVFAAGATMSRYFVGPSGALRWSTTGTQAGSVSLTGNRRHKAYMEIGNPAIKWESIDQACRAFEEIARKK